MDELPKAGWYRDPVEPSVQRYWDGEQWVGGSIPADATPPAGPLPDSPPPAWTPTTGGASTAVPGATASPVAVRPTPVSAPGTTAVARLDPTRLAPLGVRVLARIVDILAVFGLNVLVNGYFVVQYVREVWPAAQAASDSFQRGQFTMVEPSDQAARLVVVMSLIAAGLWFAYEVPAIANSGQTLGKRLAGIRVVRLLDDRPPSFGQSFRRWLLIALPSPLVGSILLLPLQLLDLLWCIWDRPAKQCLHDKAVASIVVRAEAAEATSPPPTASRR